MIMAKFLVVKEKPEDLKKGEYVIDTPSFLDEIKQNKTKKLQLNQPNKTIVRRFFQSLFVIFFEKAQ